ncbi:GNAT family N-acetyltransferase [Allobaculum sp. Allo2]|uniref:GNAT family N-acetyltransferase n=1 Tax=Allobaculum sp. Allo2 TaxID=2853432 RepID=UPI002112A396|nr:GNAT family N-acetyltransferase [Allobaculum sp. Allo2]UNT94297.1 GNAT family N-acetyltransferase [Allobaculum sp. Allo2]
MEFQSERLILRPWKAEDAQVLYELANDPDVGPAAGWPVHQSEEESRQIIESVLSNPLDFAICLKETSTPIGAISLMVPKLKQREGHPHTTRNWASGSASHTGAMAMWKKRQTC